MNLIVKCYQNLFFKYNEYIFYSNINQLMSKEQSLNKLMKWYKIDKILTSCEIIFIVFKKKKDFGNTLL